MNRLAQLTLSALLVVLLGFSLPAHAQNGGDRLVFYRHGTTLDSARLPQGPVTMGPAPQISPDGLTFAPDGRLFAYSILVPPIPIPEGFLTELFTIDAAGGTQGLGTVPLESNESPGDLTFTYDGRLYLLVSWISSLLEFGQRLVEIDPTNAEILKRHELSVDVTALAPSPRGLWLLDFEKLRHFNPITEVVDDTGVDFEGSGVIASADTDSTGALWLVAEPGFIDPPFFFLYRFDPVTGARRDAPFFSTGASRRIAIERRCQGSVTARCLQGGRFRATAQWRDHQGNTGEGQVAPSASADSALFWFFDAANWELLVKVIDGCSNNGNYWVFAAGTTDVEYTLEVTDLATGDLFTTTNPLGQAAPAVTNTTAFAGCP